MQTLRLKNFPISFYSVVLGLAGYTVAWQKAEHIFGFGVHFSYFLFYLMSFLFLLISGTYLLKMKKFHEEVKKEFDNPVKINFYPIIAKVFLLSSIIFLGFDLMYYSKISWIIGVILQFGFTLLMMSFWMHQEKFKLQHISPALFIPIVGNIIIPIAGVKHFSPEFSWFFFSIGFFLWIIFTTIVFNRIIFHHPLSEKLIPTLFILMAPPAIGFIAYVKLTGSFDIFARLLYYFSLFFFLALFAQIKYFSQIKFYLSFWAYSFPMDAFVIATIFFYHLSHFVFFKYLAIFSFALLNFIIFLLSVRTIVEVMKRRICVEEND